MNKLYYPNIRNVTVVPRPKHMQPRCSFLDPDPVKLAEQLVELVRHIPDDTLARVRATLEPLDMGATLQDKLDDAEQCAETLATEKEEIEKDLSEADRKLDQWKRAYEDLPDPLTADQMKDLENVEAFMDDYASKLSDMTILL